ncbi:MAG: hypothetical protein H7293_10530 [Candidatus Saccharibacteria bacterium]|nr:hypothetical protein [Rhodoferax sp.]
MPKNKSSSVAPPFKKGRGVGVALNTDKSFEYGAENAHHHCDPSDQNLAAADRLTTKQGVAVSDNQSTLKAVAIPAKSSDTPGILWAEGDKAASVAPVFIAAIAAHRHPRVGSDPSRV